MRLRAVAAANGVAGCRARRQCVGRGQLRVGASFTEHGGFAAAHLSVPWCRLPTRYAANGSATAAAGSTPTTADVTGSAQRLGPVLCVVVRKLHAAPLTSVALGVDHGGVGHGGVGHDGASLSQQQQQSGHRSDSASIPGARLHATCGDGRSRSAPDGHLGSKPILLRPRQQLSLPILLGARQVDHYGIRQH